MIEEIISYISNNKIWSFATFSFFCMILLYIYILFTNPYGISKTFQNTFMVTVLIMSFFLLNLILNPGKNKTVDNNDGGDLSTITILAKTKKYFLMIGYVLIMLLLLLTFVSISKFVLYHSVKVSLSLSIIVCIIAAALFYNIFIKGEDESLIKEDDDNIISFIKDIVFFIPCLLIDAIDYFKEDYQNTPSTTVILGVMLAGVLGLYYMLPKLYFLFRDKNEYNLLQKCRELNTRVLFVSNKDLMQMMEDREGLLENQFKKIYEILDNMRNSSSTVRLSTSLGYDISLNETFVEKMDYGNRHKLDNNISRGLIMSDFTDREKEIIKSLFKDNFSNIDTIFKEMGDNPDYVIDYFKKNILEKVEYTSILSTLYKLETEASDMMNQGTSNLLSLLSYYGNRPTFNYHYSVSFWVYLDSSILKNDRNDKTGVIFDYGGNPKLVYDFDKKQMIMSVMELSDKDETTGLPKLISIEKELYVTNNILYQRWNHIVINYNYGTLDLLINNNLVGSYKNISPYLEKNTRNLCFGDYQSSLPNCGICDIRYYSKPIDLQKIKKLYMNGIHKK